MSEVGAVLVRATMTKEEIAAARARMVAKAAANAIATAVVTATVVGMLYAA